MLALALQRFLRFVRAYRFSPKALLDPRSKKCRKPRHATPHHATPRQATTWSYRRADSPCKFKLRLTSPFKPAPAPHQPEGTRGFASGPPPPPPLPPLEPLGFLLEGHCLGSPAPQGSPVVSAFRSSFSYFATGLFFGVPGALLTALPPVFGGNTSHESESVRAAGSAPSAIAA